MRSTRLYGVRRRAWRMRRSVPRIARPLSRVLPASDPPQNPVFVIGCPRSGTTLLLDALSLPHEDGVLKEEPAAERVPDLKQLQAAAVQLRSAFPINEVTTYLNTLWLQDPDRWGALGDEAVWR